MAAKQNINKTANSLASNSEIFLHDTNICLASQEKLNRMMKGMKNQNAYLT